MTHDLSRVLVMQQTHRRMVDPMSFRRWDRPFVIERVDPAAASPESPSAQAAARMGGRAK